MESISFQKQINLTMHSMLRQNSRAIVMGQGVNDPTRIFGTTTGLVEEFGEARVMEMPICEEASTGMALGMSLNGLYPVQTHIRVDFLVLALNQIVNMAAKYKYMYGGRVSCPMLIRAVIGRSWGQGPQHSQSLQSILGHIPGLTVLMPSSAAGLDQAYLYAMEKITSPVISLEHRFLYDRLFQKNAPLLKNPIATRVVRPGCHVTIVATSYMVQEAQKAAEWLAENSGLQCEIIDLFNISDVDHDLIYESVSKTRHLIVADTSWLPYGVSAEICRGILMRDPHVLAAKISQLGMQHCPTPTSHALEKHFYPDVLGIIREVYKQLRRPTEIPTPLQERIQSQATQFRGPF